MEFSSSSASAPQPQRVAPPSPPETTPRPFLTPPRVPEKRRRFAVWALVAIFAILVGGGYLVRRNARTANKDSGSGMTVAIFTVTVSVGDIRETIRINGTVAAQNAVTLLAPRIQGSRSDFNRGGDVSGRTGGAAAGAEAASISTWCSCISQSRAFTSSRATWSASSTPRTNCSGSTTTRTRSPNWRAASGR